MASAQDVAKSIRENISSTTTCTPATVLSLSDLLLPKPNPANSSAPLNARNLTSLKSATKVKEKPLPVKSRTKKHVDQENEDVCVGCLSVKERSILATEVINATLKSLTEAIKTPAQSSVRKQASSKDLVKASVRKTLRRSTSLPQSPLQPRSLNRVSSSPNIPLQNKASSTTGSSVSGYRSTGECARIAFACLRALQTSKSLDASLPALQLENGMSVLIGKLLLLGLDDLAIKEIRILKRRLDPEIKQKRGTISKTTTTSTVQTLAELLDFGNAQLNGSSLSLAVATQLQILRIMASSQKPAQIESALLYLSNEHSSSPIRLLNKASEGLKDQKQLDKISRQLQSLSEIILSLCPNVSSSEDDVANNPNHSVRPEVAAQIQAIGLHSRALCWKLVEKKGDISKEFHDPVLRCLAAFARRSSETAHETYQLTLKIFEYLQNEFRCCGISLSGDQHPSIINIFRLLGSLAKDAGLLTEAIAWTTKFQSSLNCQGDSPAKRYSVMARLVSLKLKQTTRDADEEELLMKLLDDLEEPFKGDSTEIDDLMAEISYVRRAVNGLLSRNRSDSSAGSIGEGLRVMCESLVFICPRLSLRYLGNPLDSKASPKNIIRQNQRRQLIQVSALHSIDSVLFLIKALSNEERLTWELMDSKLQECLLLYERIDIQEADAGSDDEKPPPTYWVRISNLYYSQYLNMRRASRNSKDTQALRALRRAVDCLRGRSAHERRSAGLWTKLEHLAELYKQSGRFDELSITLKALRDELVSQGYLSMVANLANVQPLASAWEQSGESSALSRTTQAMIKLELKYLKKKDIESITDPTWSEEERAVVLENQIKLLSTTQASESSRRHLLCVFKELLGIFDANRYPVRRLRVLLQLFVAGVEGDSVLGDPTSTVEQCCQDSVTADNTKDEGLRSFLPSLKTLAASHLALQQERPDINLLSKSISSWSSILENCSTVTQLEDQIDDTTVFLTHLQVLADYLDVQGHGAVRLATLRLIADVNDLTSVNLGSDHLLHCYTALGAQWTHLGYSGKAGMIFDRAKELSRGNGITIENKLLLHVSYSQYLLAIGNHEMCEEQLSVAKSLFYQHQDAKAGSIYASAAQGKTKKYVLSAKAYLVSSMLALERGTAQVALTQAKVAVRLLRQAWANIASQSRDKRSSDIEVSASEDTFNNSGDASQLILQKQEPKPDDTGVQSISTCGPAFWPLVTPLFNALNFVASIYAHNGMFLETIYYTQEGHKLGSLIGSDTQIMLSSALLGSNYVKAGMLDKAAECVKRIDKSASVHSGPNARETAALLYHSGIIHGLLGDTDAEMKAYSEAQGMIQRLMDPNYIMKLDSIQQPEESLEQKLSKLSIKTGKGAAPRKQASGSKTGPKRTPAIRPKPTTELKNPVIEQCAQLELDRIVILQQKARSLISSKQPSEALNALQMIQTPHSSQLAFIVQKLTSAKQIFQDCVDQMSIDPEFSILQESTLSFPALCGAMKADKVGDRLSVAKISPPRKDTKARGRARSKSPVPDSYFDRLRRAQEHLIDVYSGALSIAPSAVVHNIASMLHSVTILLSAFGQVKAKLLAYPSYSSCSVEIAKNLSLRRERKAVLTECTVPSKVDSTSWPAAGNSESRRSSISISNDVVKFQQSYIDIIPPSWTAISIALSDSRDELSITKFQADNTPFVLRLPLGRHNSMDADEDVFGFEQGQNELHEIIRLANESAHDARDMSTKDAKAAWWEERETLDARLRDLLENIEKVWLGGFTGIFSQHARRHDLLARFQKSFQNILDKHLPSRRKTGKRGISHRATLDSRILELFVGLGDASDENCDLSEPLTDLLNFVVDVLHFHGEQNEYSEIDFDSIVIETHDALRGYHTALNASGTLNEDRHMILILDKTLHSFPWESLPCMEGLAVSRLPSLGALRDRILKQQEEMPADGPDGHYINQSNGAFILNPGGDLKNTQATFTKGLQSLNWNGIVRREPTEEEIKSALSGKDLYLYFGHGSGAQYIRAKEIRRLEKCAVSWLMGCSSGALTEAGEFEPYGPAINYMHAGCPALVATLWDVTDKDIDRFAKSAFEHWGLFEREMPAKGKGKKRTDMLEGAQKNMSLVEAVSKGREVCNLKYLNAAAVVVYGVPVYFR